MHRTRNRVVLVQSSYDNCTDSICMKLVNIQLFGIAVILAGGFLLIAESVVTQRPMNVYPGTWVVVLGLVISIAAILRAWFTSSNGSDSAQEPL